MAHLTGTTRRHLVRHTVVAGAATLALVALAACGTEPAPGAAGSGSAVGGHAREPVSAHPAALVSGLSSPLDVAARPGQGVQDTSERADDAVARTTFRAVPTPTRVVSAPRAAPATTPAVAPRRTVTAPKVNASPTRAATAARGTVTRTAQTTTSSSWGASTTRSSHGTPPPPPPPPPKSKPPTPAPPPPAGGSSSAYESRMLSLINGARAAAGVAPLTWSSCPDAYAEQWAPRMAAAGGLSHQSMSGLLSRCGARNAAENVGETSDQTPDAAMAGFMASAPHRANILNPALRYVGVAAYQDTYGVWWVAQDFTG